MKGLVLGVCGNGILEPGEECDCGSPEECEKDPCCGPDCRLRPRAECSDGNHACCQGCKVVTQETRLRCSLSLNECQRDAFCDGKSPDCPPSESLPDGRPCRRTEPHLKLKCASGICTNRDQQCRDLARRFGSTGACDADSVGGIQGEFDAECQLVCRSDEGVCIPMLQAFRDGVECQAGRGRCYRGHCMETSTRELFMDALGKFYSPPFVWTTVPLTIVFFTVLSMLIGRLVRSKK